MKRELLSIICLAITLSGCTGTELSNFNKQISDFGFLASGNDPGSSSESGMPKLSPEIGAQQSERKIDYSVSVDVDTAAARLRRYYQFMTMEGLDALKNKNSSSSRWTAGAIESSEKPEWTASPGSFYKMGRDWGEKDDHIVIDVEKNGVGSRVYVTFSSSNSQHLTDKYLGGLFAQIKSVAEGSVR